MTEHPFHASVAKVEPVGGLHAAIDWLRANLFNTWYNAVLTVLIVWALFAVLPDVMQWLIGGAEWAPDPQACRHAAGACWGFVAEKYRLILFGTYPFDEQWRPLAAMALFVALIALTCNRRFWKPSLAGAWAMGIVVISVLMWGGVLGLSYVDNLRWGGLPLTLILSTVGLLFAFPFAILLALGRRSDLPAIRAVCVAYIELVRGVPLISVLFMASVMFPLFLPDGVTIDKLLRAQVGIILFAAAYLAEVVRGGLQSVPRGQLDAADALGLGYWRKTVLIVLPQALRAVIPATVGVFISTFKDTSLVIIIGLFDLLSALKAGLNDPPWRNFYVEGYLFAAAIYFCFCFFMSRYSQRLESTLSSGER